MTDTTTTELQPWRQRLQQMTGVLLAVVSMAQALDIINVASVTIVLPDVMHDVGYKVDQLQWVSSAYALAYAAFLLLGGRLGDLFGHRNVFILGVTWFSIWSVVNGAAKTAVMLSVGRALQGMGAGFTVPSALAILTTTYPVGPARTRALGVFGGSAAIGSIVGVLLGGILGSTIGWRWIFYMTGIIGFLLVPLAILVIPAEKGQSKAADRRIDFGGLLTFTVGIVCVIYYLSEGPAAGWGVAKTLAPLIVGLASLILFVVVERKINYPIMPLHIWKSQRLVASCVIAICLTAALNTHFYYASLAFQMVLEYTPLKTSFGFIAHGLGSIVAMIGFSILVGKVRTKIILLIGWVFFIASGVVWAQLKATSSYWSIPFPSLLLNVVAMSAIWLCCQINSVADAADEDQGVVGAVYNVSLQLGNPIGIAIGNIIANKKNAVDAFGPALLPGYRAAFYAFAAMAGVGLIVTIVFAPNRDAVRADVAQSKDEAIEGKFEIDSVSTLEKTL